MISMGRTLACSVIALCLGTTSADAAQFVLRPNIAAEGSYNDNLFLSTGSKLASWRATVYPGLNLTYNLGALSVSSTASAAINRYIDNSAMNTDDQFYRLDTRYDAGRQSFNLNFRYTKIATLRTELTDTGNLQGFARQRERIVVNPSWQYGLSEITRLTAGFLYLQQSYTNPTASTATQQGQLVGTTSQGGYILIDHSLSNRLKVGSEFSYANTVGDNGYSADNFMLKFPLTYDYSETFRTSVHAGARYVLESTQGSNSTKGDAGFLFGFKFFKKFDIGQIDISLGRDVFPSGFGTQRQRDQALVGLTANISDTLSASLLTRYLRNQQLGVQSTSSSNSFQNREYFQVGPSLRWEWARNWAVTSGYLFQAQKLKQTPGTAHGDLVYVNIGYEFTDMFLPD